MSDYLHNIGIASTILTIQNLKQLWRSYLICILKARGLRVDISGRPQVTVLQLLCDIFIVYYNVAHWFWLWVIDMMLVLWFYLESTSLVKSSQKHHIQNAQSNLTSCTIYKYNLSGSAVAHSSEVKQNIISETHNYLKLIAIAWLMVSIVSFR